MKPHTILSLYRSYSISAATALMLLIEDHKWPQTTALAALLEVRK